MIRRNITAVLLIVLAILWPTSVLACPTCGCSEVCPVAMMDTQSGGAKSEDTRSSSIVGRMVLKLAYERDEKLQEIAKKLKRMNQCTTGLLSGVASGTLAQGTVSMSVLNPPAGLEDSCVPGALGLGFSGFTNVLFATKNVFGHSYRKQIHARQVEIQQQVENVLHHLEFSKMTCPEAQHELVALIGERGARDFADLWQASHGKDENDAMAAKASEALMQISTTRQNTPQ